MATSVLCLALLCLTSLIPPSQSAAPAVRSEQVLQEFVLSGGPTSLLFSQCLNNAPTVEGTLYSISVSEDEEFVRYMAKEKIDFEWTAVDLGDTPNIIDCAREAYNLGVFMFKFDGSCNVAINSAYDLRSEQACDGGAAEVVYITSRPFNIHNGRIIPLGEFDGCYYSSPEGMRYGHENGHLVHEVELPAPATCCPSSGNGSCLLQNLLQDAVTNCEARAFCDALGIPLVGKDFVEDFEGVEMDYQVDRILPKYIWLNLQRINGTWLWNPEMESLDFSIDEDDVPENIVAILYFGGDYFSGSDMLAVNYAWEFGFVYCYERTTTLPQCP